MAGIINRTDVIKWLEANGGQRGDAIIENELVDNPNYVEGREATNGPKKITRKKVTWYTENGKKLSVYDDSEDGSKNDGTGMRPGDRVNPDDGERDSAYEIDFQGVTPKDDKNYPPTSSREDGRSPEEKERAYEAARESQWNRDTPIEEGGSGRYETHEARRQRERQETQDAEAAADKKRRDTNDAKANELREKELTVRQAAEARAAKDATESAARDRDRIGLERERVGLERTRTTRPAIIGTPTYEDKYIAHQTADGSYEWSENPIYDELRAKAKEKREEMRLAVEHNQATAAQAAQAYKEWYDKEIAGPLAQLKERREQAAEKREAQKAVDEERRFAKKYELDKANLGQSAAESAQANERALLPYKVGPKFGGQVSSAINGLSGRMDQNSEDGIKFTADAFEFKRPDFAGIARNATKDALKHLTPYEPSDASKYATADYTGVTMPANTATGAQAPTAPTYIDTSQYLPQPTN